MYIKFSEDQPSPYTLGELRRDNPSTSFPHSIPESTLAEYGVYPVVEVPAPAVDIKTHTLVQGAELVGGVWIQTWQVQAIPEEQAIANVRAERTRLLASCDWTQLGDSPAQPVNAWRTYRQALRDITTQPGFPHNVTWPEEPTT